MNSCIANLLPACEPPLITLNAGTGKIISLFPAKSAICLKCKTRQKNIKQDKTTKIIYILYLLVEWNSFLKSTSFSYSQ